MAEMLLVFEFIGQTYKGYGVHYIQEEVPPEEVILLSCDPVCVDVRRTFFGTTGEIIDFYAHQKGLENGEELPTMAAQYELEVLGPLVGQLRLTFDGETTAPLDLATLDAMGGTLFDSTLKANIEALSTVELVVIDLLGAPLTFKVFMVDPDGAEITGTTTSGSVVVTHLQDVFGLFHYAQGGGGGPHLVSDYGTWEISTVGSPAGTTYHLMLAPPSTADMVMLLSKEFCPPIVDANQPNAYTSTVNPGDTIDVSFQMKWSGSVSGSQTFQPHIEITYYTLGGVYIFEGDFEESGATLTTSYQTFSYTAVVPAGAAYALVQVGTSILGGSVPNAAVHIGDLRYSLS